MTPKPDGILDENDFHDWELKQIAFESDCVTLDLCEPETKSRAILKAQDVVFCSMTTDFTLNVIMEIRIFCRSAANISDLYDQRLSDLPHLLRGKFNYMICILPAAGIDMTIFCKEYVLYSD